MVAEAGRSGCASGMEPRCLPVMCEELIELAGELDAMLHQIRSDRHVHTPVIRCPYCGHVGPAAEPDVSVRATILSLGRFGIAPAGRVKALEKAWAAHRKRNGLDLYGKKADRAEAGAPTCGHADGR